MNCLKQKILKFKLQNSSFKILVLVLLFLLHPAKAEAKNKDFKEKEGEVVQKIKQVDNTGDSILGTVKRLGIHGKTFDQVVHFFDGLKAHIDGYTNKFENSWSSIEGLKGAISSSIGDLKIPDPLKAGDEIFKQVLSKRANNSIETDSSIEADNASREFHRVYTYGQSESVLGKEGQKTQLEESQEADIAVNTSSSEAENAQSDVVTQDILKKISIQNSQAQIINKSIQGEELLQTRALAAADVNLADISGNLDKEARERDLEKENYRKEILRTAGFNDGFWEEQK